MESPDPPLQARHRGLPGRPRRGLLRDRVPARGARLLRPRRRLLEALAGPLPRPLLRQPAGLQGHGAGQLRRRHDLQPRHARPDPRRVSTDEPRRRRRQPQPEPAGRPAVTEGRVPDRAAEERSRSCTKSAARRSCGSGSRLLMSALPRPPLGLDPGALGGAGALRLVHPGGDPPGRRGDAGDPRLPGVGRQLLRPPAHRAGRRPTGSRSAPTSAAGCAAATSCSTPSRPPPRATRTSSSPASSASAPATSPRWPRSTSATSARSRRPRRGPRSSS